MTLRTFFFLIRHKRVCNRTIASARELACEALARDVEKRRNSFEVQDFIKRREAALRGRIPKAFSGDAAVSKTAERGSIPRRGATA